ncbi:root UVB sensitive 5-like protein [Drosera capensis]
MAGATTLHLSHSNLPSPNPGRRITRSRQFRVLSSTSKSTSQAEPADDNDVDDRKNRRNRGSSRLVIVERFSNGTSKRYVLDEESRPRIETFVEKHKFEYDDLQSSDFSGPLALLPNAVKDFVLPAGFPGSVSDDYLTYMLWQFPTNAVGVTSPPATAAAASAAAIRWVSKDGIGTVGRFIIGGRCGSLFDDDPKQWRMYADLIGSAGSIFDLSTQLYPEYFLLLASLGNLAKAIGRGLKDPSFRVIQNHFAVSGNLGDVAAKEEVWEVTAQLLGLGLGVGTPGLLPSYQIFVLTWMSMRLLHLWLRYQSLSVLQFNSINFKRARILAKSHVLHAKVPGSMQCNKDENILSWQRFLQPRITFGVSMEDMVRAILNVYAEEKYVLLVNQRHDRGLQIMVSFKRGATSLCALRSIWQAYWLYETPRDSDNMNDLLEQSLRALELRFDDFILQLDEAGWNILEIALKIPKEPFLEESDSI